MLLLVINIMNATDDPYNWYYPNCLHFKSGFTITLCVDIYTLLNVNSLHLIYLTVTIADLIHPLQTTYIYISLHTRIHGVLRNKDPTVPEKLALYKVIIDILLYDCKPWFKKMKQVGKLEVVIANYWAKFQG